MRIFWFNWKDTTHPLAGGAEVMNEELAKRLVTDGHEVLFIVGGYKGGKNKEKRDGFEIIRVGGRWTVYYYAYKYFKKHLITWPDLIIEEINTIPFFTQLYSKQKRFLFIYQLCREIWFYQLKLPLSLIGYVLEPFYLFFLRNNKVLTESQSTAKDLQRYGFKKKNISIIPPGTDIQPIKSLTIPKYSSFTILSFGAFREMKKTEDQIKAFELAKKKLPDLKMKLAGDSKGKYGARILALIENSPYKSDIECLGRVSQEKKIEVMQKCHVITVTSVKEGWGLIVTEANSQGTPGIVYDVDGLRDSVKKSKTGLITEQNTPQALSQAIIKLYNDVNLYSSLQKNAWQWSKELNFDTSYIHFKKSIGL